MPSSAARCHRLPVMTAPRSDPPISLAPVKSASRKSAPAKSVPSSRMPRRSARRRSASRRSRLARSWPRRSTSARFCRCGARSVLIRRLSRAGSAPRRPARSAWSPRRTPGRPAPPSPTDSAEVRPARSPKKSTISRDIRRVVRIWADARLAKRARGRVGDQPLHDRLVHERERSVVGAHQQAAGSDRVGGLLRAVAALGQARVRVADTSADRSASPIVGALDAHSRSASAVQAAQPLVFVRAIAGPRRCRCRSASPTSQKSTISR